MKRGGWIGEDGEYLCGVVWSGIGVLEVACRWWRWARDRTGMELDFCRRNAGAEFSIEMVQVSGKGAQLSMGWLFTN